MRSCPHTNALTQQSLPSLMGGNKCPSCNKDYSNKTDEELEKRINNTFKFSYNDINKFILLLRNSFHPYEYMDEWEKPLLSEKEEFYFNLNTENITYADYMQAKRVCKDLKTKKFGEYYDFYLKINTLLLVDVFENFRKTCLKIVFRKMYLSFTSC